jgi:3-phenylpropionate/trans-cinnamate dioxygenase ferredoxin component
LNAAPRIKPLANAAAVAQADAIEPGSTRRVVVEGVQILLCNVDGKLYAIDDACTHDGAPLDQGELDGRRITCPRHGAVFDVITGAVLALPAVRPVRTYICNVIGGQVYIESRYRKGFDAPTAPSSYDRDEGLDALDKTIADSFPASDPPSGPLSI